MTKEIKLIQHADDATLPLRDKQSLKAALKCINSFGSISGMSLNIDKTECMLLGDLKGTENTIHGIKINFDCTKVLGTYIGHNKEKCIEKNWGDKLKELERLFESWKKRKLTIFGKTCIINSLAISRLIYNISILPSPSSDIIKSINRLIFNFIWNKKDRIKRKTLIGDVKYGGIGIVDIESKIKAIKSSWISYILNGENNLLYFLENFKLKDDDILYILHTNKIDLQNHFLLKKLPIFYREIFEAFSYSKTTKEANAMSTPEFLQQHIWGNKLFMFKNKTLYFQNWFNKGFKYVKDIVDENGLKPLEFFSNILAQKNNLICEYFIMKNVFHKFKKQFDLGLAKHTTVIHRPQFLFHGNIYESIDDKKCKFYYKIFRDHKFEKPYYIKKILKDLNIEGSEWIKNIYINKVVNMFDKQIADFNYKLLNNILISREYLSKWKNDSSACLYCKHSNETIKHLLYDCTNVKKIWNIVSIILHFVVSWKHVIVGLYKEINNKVIVYNNVISFVALRIYKYKMWCRINDDIEKPEDIISHVKTSTKIFYLALKKSKYSNFNIDMLRLLFEKL